LLVVLVLVLLCACPRSARAESAQVVVEIDPGAEAMLDARAARRLVLLELSEVKVRPGADGRAPPLFFRVVGMNALEVRVELWERGELNEARVVSGAHGGAHLLPRRVALAAAELARRVDQKRLAQDRARQRELSRLRSLAQASAARTLDGPLALRTEYGALLAKQLFLLGPSLSAEVSLRRRVRFDFGASALVDFAAADGRTRLSWFELRVGPAWRAALTRRLDLDLAALAAASTVHVAKVAALDGIAGEQESWGARAGVAVRLEPRFSRSVRGSLGAEAGWFLRRIPLQFADGSEARLGGAYVGVALGITLTPR
jgi:hypothetical protein